MTSFGTCLRKDTHKLRLRGVLVSPAQHSEEDCKQWLHHQQPQPHQMMVHQRCTLAYKPLLSLLNHGTSFKKCLHGGGNANAHCRPKQTPSTRPSAKPTMCRSDTLRQSNVPPILNT